MFIDPNTIPPTGSGVLDAAHNRLAQVVNKAYEEWQVGGDTARLRETFLCFLGMVRRHFVQEEHIIRSSGFPGWQEHRLIHQRIEADLDTLFGELESSSWASSRIIEAFKAIDAILYEHECSEDQEFWHVLSGIQESIGDMEPLIAWTDDLRVGVDQIDREHKALVKSVNRVYVDMISGADAGKIESDLEALHSQVTCHFATEEMYMEEHNTPGLAVHRVLHTNLVNDFKGLSAQYREGRYGRVSEAFQKRLKFWLLDHMIHVDKGIGESS